MRGAIPRLPQYAFMAGCSVGGTQEQLLPLWCLYLYVMKSEMGAGKLLWSM